MGISEDRSANVELDTMDVSFSPRLGVLSVKNDDAGQFLGFAIAVVFQA